MSRRAAYSEEALMKTWTAAPILMGGSLAFAALCAVGVDHGWWFAAPILLAVAIVSAIRAKLNL
jgi:hypothetical protein